MKQLYLILVFVCLGCNAQTPVLSLFDDEYGSVNGAYYKDTNNDLDNYVGTWKYTSGNTTLTITLQKKIMMPYNDNTISFFEDVLVGEYKYIENAVEKINTLANISIIYDEARNYNIYGNIIIGPGTTYCYDCGPNDKKVLLMFRDPTCHILGYDPEMFFQRADSNGVQKLKLVFRTSHGSIVEEGVTPPCTEYKVPFGEYLLTKQ